MESMIFERSESLAFHEVVEIKFCITKGLPVSF